MWGRSGNPKSKIQNTRPRFKHRTGWVFVISGPSGGGKTTLVSQLRRAMPRLVRSVSVTTRPPRSNERRGRDYHFVTPAQFQRMRRTGQLLEWARVHSAYYGTPKAPLVNALAQGRDAILSIDVQGARQVRRALGARAVLIFVRPASFGQLRQRLQRRRTDSPQAIRHRLVAARRELTCASWYDHTVVNDRVRQAVKQLCRIVSAHRAQMMSRASRRSRERNRRQGKGCVDGASAD